jgi:hypothetical protein
MLLAKDNHNYLQVAFTNEEEIERVILDNIGLLFGDYSCLLPKSKLLTMGGKGSIPDGILIDFETKEWFIIEVERATHGTWQHIAPQISRQLTAIMNDDSKGKIISLALDQIGQQKELKDLLSEIDIQEMHIHRELQQIIEKPPILALPIDEIPDDLEDYLRTLKIDFRIWIIEKFIDEKNEIIYSIPDFNQARSGPATQIVNAPNNEANQGSLMSRVVRAGILKDGEPVHMDYGPKGKPKKHFEGFIRENGIEIDGKVYSPSIAALRCIQTVSSTRNSSNGWVVWKTMDGSIIDNAYKRLMEMEKE